MSVRRQPREKDGTIPPPVVKPFRQQFLELFTGNTLAQVLSVLLMPAIIRLYSPSEFGEYGIYVAVSSIVGGLSNFRLDVATILAEDDQEGSHLVYVGGASALVGGFLVTMILLIMGYHVQFATMTGLSVAAIGGCQCLAGWHSKRRHYKLLASRNVGEKLLVLGVGLTLGWLGYTHGGLIVAQTVGLLFSYTYLFTLSQLPHWKSGTLNTLKKFSEFPRKNALSAILTLLYIFLPTLLFANYFTRNELGNYNLTARLFEVPITLVGYTFSMVYYQHSSTVTPVERLRLFGKSLRFLCLLFIPPFVLIMLFGPDLFSIVFGEAWREAGALARWFAPMTLMRLLFVSQSTLLLLGRQLGIDLRIAAFVFAAQIGGFFVGLYMIGSVHGCVMTMCALGVAVFSYGLWMVYRTLPS